MMNELANPYRNATEEVAKHAQRLLAKHGQGESETLGRIYRWRWARIGFGAVGVIAACLALLYISISGESPVLALALGWAATFAGGTGGYHWAARRDKSRHRRLLGASDDPYEQVLRLSNATETDEEDCDRVYQIAKLGLTSHRLPLLVGALLLPLSLVACFLILIDTGEAEMRYGLWYALMCTIHVHLYALFAAWTYPIRQRAIYVISVATTAGLLPFMLPALVVGVIATLIVGIYFGPLSAWLQRENQCLAIEQRRQRNEQCARIASPEDESGE